jgi:hypothetical protein
MATSLKDALAQAGVELTPEEELQAEEELQVKHRAKSVLERPKEEVKLGSISLEGFEPKKTQKDPTEDLVFLPRTCKDSIEDVEEYQKAMGESKGYLVWCANTEELWIAPTKLCLDANFIYREDLEITELTGDVTKDFKVVENYITGLRPGISPRKYCYILDIPGNESYEVYYDSAYPSLKYGQATPTGSFIHKYINRFHRDMAILELDKLYSESSAKKASKQIEKQLKPHEAVIISDGAWLKNTCTSAFWFIDATSAIKFTEGVLPSEPDQAVLIAEIRGATNALQLCYAKGKKKIRYYYDNTSILNVFRNRKTEYIAEVKEYKELLEKLNNEGYQVTFIELHPKTGEDRIDDNKALLFFHNSCDAECRTMADIFKKDYKSFASVDDKQGKTYSAVKEEFKPKGKPGQSSGKGYQNNSRNGNNKFGKRI